MAVQELENLKSHVDRLSFPSLQLNITPHLQVPHQQRVSHKETLMQTASHIDAQCDTLKDIIVKLRDIRDSLVRKRASIQNDFASVNVLPPEILLDIFARAVNDRWAIDCAVAISQTSSAWRRIALAFPPLWNHIDPRRTTRIDIPTILERASNLPLSLDLEADGPAAWLLDDGIFFTRWKSLSIRSNQIEDAGWIAYITRDYCEPFPNLETLVIVAPFKYPPLEMGEDSILGKDVPSLKTLQLENCNLWKLVAPSLEDLVLDTVEFCPSSIASLFQNCSDLKRVYLNEFDDGMPDDYEGSSDVIVNMAYLDSLHFAEIRPRILSQILRIIRAPNLRELKIHPPELPEDYDIGDALAIPDLLERFPKLRHLDMTWIPHSRIRSIFDLWAQHGQTLQAQSQFSALHSLEHLTVVYCIMPSPDDLIALHTSFKAFCTLYIPPPSPPSTHLVKINMNTSLFELDSTWYKTHFHVETLGG